ncbi:hypothetical protein ARUE_c39530 [Arthrobacter sp. Rue61a]|nr:hypothetical protein ARUE_c39530 [Arthrobacter sp. Rue61a]
MHTSIRSLAHKSMLTAAELGTSPAIGGISGVLWRRRQGFATPLAAGRLSMRRAG